MKRVSLFYLLAAGTILTTNLFGHKVENNGSFSYSYPIEVPQGTNGLQPKLSISYNSNSGNGLVGMGFNLQGLPVISRINYGSGINFNGNDVYSGPVGRLVDVSGNKTKYHNKNENWDLYTPQYGSCGVAPDEPCSWIVFDKSGNKLYFGQTTDSNILPYEKVDASNQPIKSAKLWALNRIEDIHGNYMDVEYIQDQGQVYPSKIIYTKGNGQQATHTIFFNYETRADISTDYKYEQTSVLSQRLASIEVYSDCGIFPCSWTGSLARIYQLNYVYGEVTGRSLLTSIKITGSPEADAIPPTQFDWQGKSWQSNQKGWIAKGTYTPPHHIIADTVEGQGGRTNADMGLRFVELNGDGLIDFVYYRWSSPGEEQKGAYLNTGNGWAWAPQYTPPHHIVADATNAINERTNSDMGVRFIDINGDGLVDFLYHRELYGPGSPPESMPSGSSQAGAYLNTGNGWSSAPQFTPPWPIVKDTYAHTSSQRVSTDWGVKFIDFTSDGLPDILVSLKIRTATFNRAYINTGNGWQRADQYAAPFLLSRPGYVQAGLTVTDINKRVDTTPYLGNQFFDINGDGLNDIINAHQYDTVSNGVAYSNYNPTGYYKKGKAWQFTGDLALPVPLVGASYNQVAFRTNVGMGVRFGNLNGDGLVDLVYHRFVSIGNQGVASYINRNGKSWQLFPEYNVSHHIVADTFEGDGKRTNSDMGFRMLDLNGDGLSDYLYHRWSSGETQQGAFLNRGKRPDLLILIVAPNGLTTRPVYKPLTQVNGAIASLTNSCGGGYSVTNDVNGEYSIREFNQTAAFTGILMSEKRYLADGTPVSAKYQSEFSLLSCNESGCISETDAFANKPKQIRIGKSQTIDYVVQGQVSQIENSFYDSYGNIIKTVSEQFGGSSFRQTSTKVKIINQLTSPRAIGVVYEREKCVLSGAQCSVAGVLEHSRVYYDNQPLASLGSRGLVTIWDLGLVALVKLKVKFALTLTMLLVP